MGIRWRGAAAGLSSLLLASFASAAAPLSAEEIAGRQIYREGTSPSGTEIQALVGMAGTPVPGKVVPCGNCHGPDGLGQLEGGVAVPAITWAELTRSYGHAHETGRTHPAFSETSFVRALAEGLDPAGNRLDPAMPRYTLSAQDARSLAAYLRRIERDPDPGLTADSLTLGTVLPSAADPRLAAVGEAMRAVLAASLQELNEAGGLFGRKLILKEVALGATPQATRRNAAAMLREGGVFALLAPFAAGAEHELAALAEEEKVPIVGPFTLVGDPVPALNRYTFYLFGGLMEQARVLAHHAAHDLGAGRAAIVQPENEIAAQLAQAIADEMERRSRLAAVLKFAPGRFDPEAILQALAAAGAEQVFFLGSAAELAAFLTHADARNYRPHVLVPATSAARVAIGMPAGFDGRVHLAYPMLPGAVASRSFTEFQARHRLPDRPLVPQMSTYSAAVLLGEGLRRAGRRLSREKLVAALEAVQDFHTGLLPPLSFNAQRRIGAAGAQVVVVDLKERSFRPVGRWVRLE
jgi:ABC-type branched-subunit amino acid transport system substrate-binding protein